MFLSPFLLQRIILLLQDASAHPDRPGIISDGIILSLLLVLVYMLQSLCFQHYFGNNVEVQAQVSGALITSIYDKSCKLSSSARTRFTSGFIHNLMATDARTLSDLALYLNTLWSGVEQIFVALVFLVKLLGWLPTAAGVLVVVCSIPIQGNLISLMRQTREEASQWTDERVKTVSEALDGIRLVKLYAWEAAFIRKIMDSRLMELKLIKWTLNIQAWNTSLVSAIPTLLSLITFGTFVLVGGTLDAAIVFPAIALFNVLRPPMLILPSTFVSVARSAAAASRIQKFLLAEELMNREATEHAVQPYEFANSEADIIIENAVFSWDREYLRAVGPTLSSISLCIPRGSLTCVVGATASGKSSLLAAMLGEIPILKGRAGIRRTAKIAFCHQTPFIQNATVRDNILFGRDMHRRLYRRVLQICCLVPDLKEMPAGDLTEIGARGVNLSGGQRARVSLARAVYSESEVVLLDSPLSAVDAQVGREIFEQCIVKELAGCTRVMTTNHLNFASSSAVDYVVVLRDGAILEFGRCKDLLATETSAFATLIASQSSSSSSADSRDEFLSGDLELDENDPSQAASYSRRDCLVPSSSQPSLDQADSSTESVFEADAVATETMATDSGSVSDDSVLYNTDEIASQGRLIDREGKSSGRVRFRHYIAYMHAAGGPCIVILILVLAICGQAFNVGVNIWLSIWSGNVRLHGSAVAAEEVPRNLTIYAFLGVAAIVFQSAALFTVARGSVRASVALHESLCLRIFGAPISFFDTTPTGRIINRFNASVDKVDNLLASTLQSVLRMVLGLSSTIALIVYATPGFVLFIVPAAACFLYVQEFYRQSAVDLRRLESVARSPLYSHFGETLDGVMTLRAYASIPRLRQENFRHSDLYVGIAFASASANRWLSVRLESLAMLMVFGASSLAVMSYRSVPAELSGLVLSYAMQMVTSLSWAVRQVTDAESQMSAVEQISEYSTSPPFPQEEKLSDDLEEQNDDGDRYLGLVSAGLARRLANGRITKSRHPWPKNGEIGLSNVTMRYRENLEPALRGVSLSIEPGCHIGIVGRSGSGKTSLVSTLFRLQELEEGRVEIDGQDISKMKLQDLRSSLSIIAQEPQLFSGTIRSNLDMENIYDDAQINNALQVCGLRDTAQEQMLSLDTVVLENGSNLSAGQRQLLCLGRALLRDSTILVLDEATASLDDRTDGKVNEVIRSQMSQCTIVTVAHRLHTVMQCDKICVMDKGRLAEFGSPGALLDRPSGSMFADLVAKTGSKTSKYLRELAKRPRRDFVQSDVSSLSRLFSNERMESRSRRQKNAIQRVKSAFVYLRSALNDMDAPDWCIGMDVTEGELVEWRVLLRRMVNSLGVLADSKLQNKEVLDAADHDAGGSLLSAASDRESQWQFDGPTSPTSARSEVAHQRK